MNAPGCLLDTGPLVALLIKNDKNHEWAKKLFANAIPPLRTCEAVIAEACFLTRNADTKGPEEIISLGQKGVCEISLGLNEQWDTIHSILRKYRDRPISLADACLIRCAEIYQESRILTFDSDFKIYRWGRNKRFEIS